MSRKLSIFFTVLLFALLQTMLGYGQAYLEASFHCQAFDTTRWYRIYLPKNYSSENDKRYPVIYYFHGYGGRYKWDGYGLEDDVHYPKNGRKEPPYVMEWSNYVQDHDVIIVTWDGYEPNLHPGRKIREGIRYGNCPPYDYPRAHDTKNHHWGWDYRMYFRELVDHIDLTYRTIPVRSHRAITGLSMGGLTAYYIAGQNKDLISSVSTFDPADNLPLYGPKGGQVVWPNLEMYRALQGISTRLTMTDGDWLKVNDWKIKRIMQTAYGQSFDFHLATYPNHWAADIDQQLDFHRHQFDHPSPAPKEWNHICPGFSTFGVWNYLFEIERQKPALTILENMRIDRMKIYSRSFIPEGPIVQNETITMETGEFYRPLTKHRLAIFNISDKTFSRQKIRASDQGKLKFTLPGGGHIIGIHGPGDKRPILQILDPDNRTYHYFEDGKSDRLDFHLVNTGNRLARDLEIKAISRDPDLIMDESSLHLKALKPHTSVALKDAFQFHLANYRDSTYISSIDLTIAVGGQTVDTHKVFFYPTPVSPIIPTRDLLILDGRSVDEVAIYQQGPNKVERKTISGGRGNGDGIINPGEEVLIYARLTKGMGPNDIDTYHRTYLVNHLQLPKVSVENLHYIERTNQAGMTSTATLVSVDEDCPTDQPLDFWLKIESLYNDKNDPTSNATIYQEKYDYRHAHIIPEN